VKVWSVVVKTQATYLRGKDQCGHRPDWKDLGAAFTFLFQNSACFYEIFLSEFPGTGRLR
jgi:hypothetical protein